MVVFKASNIKKNLIKNKTYVKMGPVHELIKLCQQTENSGVTFNTSQYST